MRKLFLVLIVVSVSGCVSVDSGSVDRTATVTEVVDGDTIDVRFHKAGAERIRLIGIDTPEVYGGVNPEEFEGVPSTNEGEDCLKKWASNASDFTRNRLEGKNVTFRSDKVGDRRGDYGRLLGYIYLNSSESINRELLETGRARLYESKFDQRDSFEEAERIAINKKKGLWSCAS